MTAENEVQGDVPARAAPSDRVLTLPNALSMLRLLGVPLFLWLVLTEHDQPPSRELQVFLTTDRSHWSRLDLTRERAIHLSAAAPHIKKRRNLPPSAAHPPIPGTKHPKPRKLNGS